MSTANPTANSAASYPSSRSQTPSALHVFTREAVELAKALMHPGQFVAAVEEQMRRQKAGEASRQK